MGAMSLPPPLLQAVICGDHVADFVADFLDGHFLFIRIIAYSISWPPVRLDPRAASPPFHAATRWARKSRSPALGFADASNAGGGGAPAVGASSFTHICRAEGEITPGRRLGPRAAGRGLTARREPNEPVRRAAVGSKGLRIQA